MTLQAESYTVHHQRKGGVVVIGSPIGYCATGIHFRIVDFSQNAESDARRDCKLLIIRLLCLLECDLSAASNVLRNS